MQQQKTQTILQCFCMFLRDYKLNILNFSWQMTNVTHKFLSIYLFITLYMFRAHSAHHQERKIASIQPLVTIILLVNDQRDAQITFCIFIYNSLHVSSTKCPSSGETNCVNTTSGNNHSMLVAELWK